MPSRFPSINKFLKFDFLIFILLSLYSKSAVILFLSFFIKAVPFKIFLSFGE